MSIKFLKSTLLILWLIAPLGALAADEVTPAKTEEEAPFEIPTKMVKPSKEADVTFKNGMRFYKESSQFFTQDYERAAELFVKAAEQDHPEALYYLATLYNEGKGVKKDEKYAEQLYRRAAELGHPDSQMIVGVLYVFEAIQSKPASEEEKAALNEAARWMRNPAEKGVSEAEFFYGDMLVKGTGVEKDIPAGIAYIKKAADKNNPNAQALLGTYYWQGTGLEKDSIEGLKWVLLAHHGENENARRIIAEIAKGMSVEDKKQASDAAEAWLIAYEKAHPEEGKQWLPSERAAKKKEKAK